MLDFETQISSIDFKVRQLINERNTLILKVSELQEKQKELEDEINNSSIIIKKLEEQNKILKLGNTLNNKGDSTEIKIKINRLIREIDESIETLTKVE